MLHPRIRDNASDAPKPDDRFLPPSAEDPTCPGGSRPHHALGLLYHELFHAYLDYLFSAKDPKTLSQTGQAILALANEQLRCHYRFVRINPIRQRKAATELRFLSKEDAWEVLNETWAVFVGWTVWTKLEIFHGNVSKTDWSPEAVKEWSQRLTQASQSGELLGYYEPDDPEERRVARKRFIAPSNGMTPQDTERILADILKSPPEIVQASTAVIQESKMDIKTGKPAQTQRTVAHGSKIEAQQ